LPNQFNSQNHPLKGVYVTIIEIYQDDHWREAGVVRLLGDKKDGTLAPCLLEYHNDYAFEHLDETGCAAFSLRHPVNFSVPKTRAWPSFLLDLMPSGAARRVWEHRLGIPNSKQHDWMLLNQGACNPIGNMRIPSLATDEQPDAHPRGFSLDEILIKNEDFLEYAFQRGAPVSGTTGAAGDAPKFMLTQSKNGNWHPAGGLRESEVKSEWIIKFLRGRTKNDHMILESEPCLYSMAVALGLRGGYEPTYHPHAVLIPRFDVCTTQTGLERKGVESLYSAMGISEFGVPASHEDALRTIGKYTEEPEAEVMEYLLRDVFNYLIGNVDNHGRNTSFIKHKNGKVQLSPIYDTTAMTFDPQLLARTMRWEEVPPNSHTSYLPNYDDVTELCSSFGVNLTSFTQRSQHFIEALSHFDTSHQVPFPMISDLIQSRIKPAIAALNR
jgi:serine/threonine-protein kinase HipA